MFPCTQWFILLRRCRILFIFCSIWACTALQHLHGTGPTNTPSGDPFSEIDDTDFQNRLIEMVAWPIRNSSRDTETKVSRLIKQLQGMIANAGPARSQVFNA